MYDVSSGDDGALDTEQSHPHFRPNKDDLHPTVMNRAAPAKTHNYSAADPLPFWSSSDRRAEGYLP